MAALSEPDPGSVRAYAASQSPDASLGRKRSFCASVPASLIPRLPSSCTAMMRPLVAQTFESSSIVTSVISELCPTPPYSSSYMIPKRSFSRKSSTTSHGNSAPLSISCARGAIRSRASARTSSRISRCSSVSGSTGTRRSVDPALAHPRRRNSPVVRDRLDVVAVRIEEKGRVVAALVPPLAGRAVVDEAGLGARAPERVDRRVVGRREREMEVLGRLPVVQPQATVAGEEPGGVVEPVAARIEDLQHGRVEALRERAVPDAEGEVVDLAGRALDAVKDGLDVVAVGIEDERAVVALVVVRADPGRAVVGAARVDRGAPESIDVRARARRERDVDAPRARAARRDRDREVAPLEELRPARNGDLERREPAVVEAAREIDVRDADRHVVEHARDDTRRVRV